MPVIWVLMPDLRHMGFIYFCGFDEELLSFFVYEEYRIKLWNS